MFKVNWMLIFCFAALTAACSEPANIETTAQTPIEIALKSARQRIHPDTTTYTSTGSFMSQNGFCVNAGNVSNTGSSAMELATCSASSNNDSVVFSSFGSTLAIEPSSKEGTLCLDIATATSPASLVWTSCGTPNFTNPTYGWNSQTWFLAKGTLINNYPVYIGSASRNLCIAISSNNDEAGTTVDAEECAQSGAQAFTPIFFKTQIENYSSSSGDDGYCLQAASGALELWSCNGSPSYYEQVFTLDQYRRVTWVNVSNQAYFLDLTWGASTNSSVDPGFSLQDAGVSSNELTWYYFPIDYVFSSTPSEIVTPESGQQHTGMCLDLNGDSVANGTAIDVYECNGTNAQNWDILPL